MSTYRIVLRQRQPGYRVDIVSNDGTRHSVLEFETEADAQAWVQVDQGLEAFRYASPPTQINEYPILLNFGQICPIFSL